MTRVTRQLLNTLDSADLLLFGPLILLQPPVCCHLLHSEWSCTSTTGLWSFYWVCGLIHAGKNSVQEWTTCSLMCAWMGRNKVEYTAEMYACFWPSQKKCMFSWAKVRIIYSAIQAQISYYSPKPRNASNLLWSSCQISNMHIHTTCTIPSSRKSPSGPMFFYHQIVCEEKYSVGIWTRVSYILVRPPTHAEIIGLTLTWPLNLVCFYTIYSNSSQEYLHRDAVNS